MDFRIVKFTLYFLIFIFFIQIEAAEPKNIIIMIADGWGYNQIQATNYFTGVDSTSYQKFLIKYPMSTYSLATSDSLGYNSAKAWSDDSYVKSNYTGSASAATAMASGFKTDVKKIGVTKDDENLFLLTELAKSMGKSAGVVTNVEFSHATPAGFSVHNPDRNNYSEIANSLFLDSRLDVVMGAGHPKYDNNATIILDSANHDYTYVGGKSAWNNLLDNKTIFDSTSINGSNTVKDIDGDNSPDVWTVISDSVKFVNLAESTNPPKRVLGVPYVRQTTQELRSTLGDVKTDTAFSQKFNMGVPSLRLMAQGALNVLDENPNGLFVMIEGGAIDWAGHSNSLARSIEEMTDFNDAVDGVISWIELHGGWDETLLIVTGDHETGYLVGSDFDSSDIKGTYNVSSNGVAKMPAAKFTTGSHTNQLIPFFANGNSSELFNSVASKTDEVRGNYIDNTNVAGICFQAWGYEIIDSITLSKNHNFKLNFNRDSSIISIKNLVVGKSKIKIYTIMGELLYIPKVLNGESIFKLNEQGVFILQIDNNGEIENKLISTYH